jgi:Zn-dependent protease
MRDITADLDTAAADIPVTRPSREVLEHAVELSRARGLPEVDPMDVLRSVLESSGGLTEEAIRAAEVDPAALRAAVPADGAASDLPLRQLLVNANREATVLGHYRVDPVHLLLALMYSDSRATSAILQKAGLTLYDLRRHLQTGAIPKDPVAVRPAAAKAPDRALRRRPLPRMRGVLGLSPIFLGLLALMAASGTLLWLGQQRPWDNILTLVFVTAAWIASVCIHEFGHAFVAYIGGDQSVAASGYLTLDPLRYTHVLMSIALPIAALLLGGFGLPGGAVYINHAALRSKWWDSAVSLAGPVGTALCGLLVAAVFVISVQLGWINTINIQFYEALAFVGLLEGFAVLINLVPIPPLDGFGILRPWLPYSVQGAALRLGMGGMVLVFLLLWYVPPVSDAFWNAVIAISQSVGIDPNLAFIGQAHMRFQNLNQ